MCTRAPQPAASVCSARAARRITSLCSPMPTWSWPHKSSATAPSAARASAALQFPLPSQLAKRKKLSATPSRTPLPQFASAMAWTPASKWVRSSLNKASSASSRSSPQALAKARRPFSTGAIRKFPATNPAISSRQPSSMACLPPARLATRKSSVPCSVWFMPIRLTTPWNFCAAAPTATKPRFSPPAVPPPANSATRPRRGISASISASPLPWPISPSAAGKRVSSASFTARAATPSNFLPNPKLSSSAGRARRHASFDRLSMKKGIIMTPKRFAYFFLVLFLFGATPVCVLAQNAAGTDADSGEVEDILKETQKQVGGNHRIGIVWWIPADFWEASAKRQGSSPERAREMFASLREYTIVCVAVGKMGIGTINWSTEADVRSNTVLRDSAGINYKSVTELSSDAQGLLSIVKPVLTNVLGPMGQNLQFLLYPAKTSAGSTIADARRPGSFSVVISDL